MIGFLHNFGEVLTEHVGDRELTAQGNDGPNDRYIYIRDMAWLNQCDLVVAEVTTPSLGVGYELGQAVFLDKPVLCLFKKGSQHRLSAMIAGSPNIEVVEYTGMEEAENYIKCFFDRVVFL